MIIYDKSTFLGNNSCQKIRTLERREILQSKERSKDIMISDFLLP